MTEQETREKIADKVYEVLRKSSKLQDGKRVLILNINGINKVAERVAYSLIFLGIGDVKEIKYRVRRAEKALYIACRETAEIIFKDDFDRHAQEYMYGYLIQAEKELAEEWEDD